MNKNDSNLEEKLEEQIEDVVEDMDLEDSEDEDQENDQDNETGEDSEDDDSEGEDSEITGLKEQLEKQKAEAAKLRRLLGKKERQQKKAKRQTSKTPANAGISRDEVEEIFLSKEYSEDEIDELRSVAKGKDITLTQAAQEEVFISWKKVKDEKKRRSESRLGSSRGGSLTKKQEFPTDRESHKEFWKKKSGL